MKRFHLRPSASLLLSAALIALLLSACGANNKPTMPDFVVQAPPRVEEMYHYAIEHSDDLAAVPCYCGCGNMGHTSNLSCYIQERKPDGSIVFDSHATGCGICVDIAQDVKRMRAEGKSLSEVRTVIDATYGSYGPGTNTPLPEE